MDETVIAVDEEAGLRVAFGQLLTPLVHNERQVPGFWGELGDIDALQRPVESDLARRRWQQVLATRDVSDPHQSVIDRANQDVEWFTVGAGNDEVWNQVGLELSTTVDEVFEDNVLIRHAQTNHRLAAFRAEDFLLPLGEIAVIVVVAQLRVVVSGPVMLLNPFSDEEGLVSFTGVNKALQYIGVDTLALRLVVQAVRTVGADVFASINTEPTQSLDDRLIGLFGVMSDIGILDAGDQLATGTTGICPVE